MNDFAPSGVYRQHADHPVDADLDVDLDTCREARQLLDRLGIALDFPDWYGGNFDALADCLADPDWRDGTATLIRLSGLTRFSQQSPADYALLLAVLDAACQARSEEGAPLAVILEDGPETLPPWPAA
ncbi:barstar family protein [Azonexus sp.]|uniref:barstar family protein n=1 Tax=Azonexus sp. TaxID=1872668 RepID=UPI0035AF4E9B